MSVGCLFLVSVGLDILNIAYKCTYMYGGPTVTISPHGKLSSLVQIRHSSPSHTFKTKILQSFISSHLTVVLSRFPNDHYAPM